VREYEGNTVDCASLTQLIALYASAVMLNQRKDASCDKSRKNKGTISLNKTGLPPYDVHNRTLSSRPRRLEFELLTENCHTHHPHLTDSGQLLAWHAIGYLYYIETLQAPNGKGGHAMTDHPYQERLEKCCRLMQAAGLDALLLTKPANMFYLTGDGRLCAYAMITQQGQVALGVPITDVEDVKQLARFDHIVSFDDEIGMIHSIAHYFERFGIQTGAVGLEYTFLTQSMMGMLTHPHAKPEGVTVKDCTHILSGLRLVKDDGEIARIRAAAQVATVGMAAAIESVGPDMTESQVAAEGEYAMRQAGADEFWRTYVSSGPRTQIAHGLPTQRKLQPGDLVMIDMHPIVDGYSADICRTVCVGQPTSAQQAAYDLYLQAQQATIAKVQAGVGMVELEQILHGVIAEAGHAEHIFGPPIHGVGIEFEEAPLPPGHAFFHGEEAPPPLEANVVIAVGNCGLYAGPWGVRVEDTTVVGVDGATVLTDYPRSLAPE
jgi:Xaa-Pro aminopeptidase